MKYARENAGSVIRFTDLPGATARQFEGYLFGEAPMSFFVASTPPGRGLALHTHPYVEVFVVQTGALTFVLGDQTLEVTGGHVVIVPKETPHKYTDTGPEIAQHVDIHASAQMQTTWLEE